ncbi:hypothetical protein GF373_17885 [bacterium]|nr:hypothetical protein [bacterium]
MSLKVSFINLITIALFIIQPLPMKSLSAESGQSLHAPQAKSAPDWLTKGVMYQIFLRSFISEGTLQAAAERLPNVAELGANIIYLCPVYLQDDDMRKEFWSPRQKASGANNPRNPYRIKDYYSIDPEYGTKEDLREFIDTAHELGIRVLMDLVYLHCGPTSVLVKKHPEYLKRDANGNIVKGNWNFPALNFRNQELREYLWSNMEYWVQDFDVDGFRCDVSSGIPLEFWEGARTRLDEIRPGLVMLAEGERRKDQIKAFDISYSFTWLNAIHDVFLRGEPASLLRKTWETMSNERPRGARFIRYTENHDIVNNRLRAEVVCSERGAAAVSIINFTLDGVPMLYNGQEIGDTSPQSIFTSWPMRWNPFVLPKAKARFKFYQKLCQLRQDETAINAGKVIWLENDHPDSTISFLRRAGADEILTIASLTNRRSNVQIECTGQFHPLLADKAKLNTASDQIALDLGPFGYYVGKR